MNCDEENDDNLLIKILATLSAFSAMFTYSILIWFTICREDRLQKSDEERKFRASKKRKDYGRID